MRFSSLALAAFAPATFAAPPSARDGTQEVHLIWLHDKETGQKSLTLTDAAETKIYGHACDAKLDGVDFKRGIDHNGFGDITVFGKKYKVHGDPMLSGGAQCGKKFNAKAAEVTCSIPNVPSKRLRELDAADVKKCFDDEFSLFRSFNSSIPDDQIVAKRQGGGTGCFPASCTLLIGDGDPHQNFLHKQISENLVCDPSHQCVMGADQGHDYTIGYSVSAEIFGWITGGFSVSETASTGSHQDCYGDGGDTVCEWYNMAHTAYTVGDGSCNPCGGSELDPNGVHAVIKSPNKNNAGGGFYCVNGATNCRTIESQYWQE